MLAFDRFALVNETAYKKVTAWNNFLGETKFANKRL